MQQSGGDECAEQINIPIQPRRGSVPSVVMPEEGEGVLHGGESIMCAPPFTLTFT
jgi:hypothetical protein